MLRSVIRALPVALLLSACTNSTIRSQEGHACSTSSDDDPQLLCTPAQDLVCITTYNRMVMNVQEAAKFDGGVRQVFVCRYACNAIADCPQQGDVCCPGMIYGKTYNKIGGCVPPSACEAMFTDDDAGAPPDAPPKLDARPDAAVDGGAADVAAADVAAPSPDTSVTPDAPSPADTTTDAPALTPDAGATD